MITASEARFKAENKQVMEDTERIVENAVMSASEMGDFKVGVYIDNKLNEEGRKIIKDNLEKLGYKVSIVCDPDTYDVIMIEW